MSVRDIAALLEAGVECIAIGVRQYYSLAQVLRFDVVAMVFRWSESASSTGPKPSSIPIALASTQFLPSTTMEAGMCSASRGWKSPSCTVKDPCVNVTSSVARKGVSIE